MSVLSITSFVSLDGVMQAPGGSQEDPSGGFSLGGWVVPYFNEASGAFIDGIFQRADAFLLGRKTYEIFASYWPKMTDPGDRVASALNGLPKHVATRTLAHLDWSGSAAVRDPIAEVASLKGRYARELQVHGSPGLVRSLLAAGVVDELNLLVFPVVLGSGKRLWDGSAKSAAFDLVSSEEAGGVLLSRYRLRGPVRVGELPAA